jgi:cytoskeletal protein CcmA (bactofilin family)
VWKKGEPDRSERRVPATPARGADEFVPTGGVAPSALSGGSQMSSERSGDRAIIGPSITIKGDVTGDEDLMIQGRIEGKVDLAQHNVTVGANGRIKANIFGRSVTVEGDVEGDLHAEEQISIRKSGKVRGNISAPRVTIEDGAMFKGSIDMEHKTAPRPASTSTPSIPGPTAGAAQGSTTPQRPGDDKHTGRGD